MNRLPLGTRCSLMLPAAAVLCVGIIGWLAVRRPEGLPVDTEWAQVDQLAADRPQGFAVPDRATTPLAVDLAAEPGAVELPGGPAAAGDAPTEPLTRRVPTRRTGASASALDNARAIVMSSDNASVGQNADLRIHDTMEGHDPPVGQIRLGLERNATGLALIMGNQEVVAERLFTFVPGLVVQLSLLQHSSDSGEMPLLRADDSRDLPLVKPDSNPGETRSKSAIDGVSEEGGVASADVPEYDLMTAAAVDRSGAVVSASALRNVLLAIGAIQVLLIIIGVRLLRRRLETSLISVTRAKARFTALFTFAPTAMILVDASGKIHQANEWAEQLLGYTVGELTGMNVDALVPEKGRSRDAALRSSFDQARTSRAMRSGQDFEAMCKNGAEVPVEVSFTPIEVENGTMIIVALANLTHHKRTEAALQQRADELARSNRDLDDFAYMAAHDLKSPLRAMESLASFVREDYGHLLPEAAQADLAEIESRGQKLTAQLNGLLQYARIGRDADEVEHVDMNQLIEDLCSVYVPSNFSVVLETDLRSALAPPAALELIFRNLLMNSVKHHDQSKGTISVSCVERDDHVVYRVTDDGPGIPLEHSDKIFQIFGMIGHGNTSNSNSGLGLALVKRTLETHGGAISLVPTPERGTTFEILWPLTRQRPQRDEADQSGAEPLSRSTPREGDLLALAPYVVR